MGVKIVGVSFDAPEKLAEWKASEKFPYELWSDSDRELALHYGAADSADQGAAKRVTRVLDAKADLVLGYEVGMRFAGHPEDVLHDVKKLFKD